MKWLIAVLALVMSGTVAFADSPRLLPDNLQLSSITGDRVSSSNLAFPGKWLIAYLSGNEKTDREVLAAMEEVYGNPSGGRITVIVPDVTVAELDQLHAKHQKLSGIRWTADTDRLAAKALELPGTNFIIGLRGNQIIWTFAGSRMEYGKLRSMLMDWIR